MRIAVTAATHASAMRKYRRDRSCTDSVTLRFLRRLIHPVHRNVFHPAPGVVKTRQLTARHGDGAKRCQPRMKRSALTVLDNGKAAAGSHRIGCALSGKNSGVSTQAKEKARLGIARVDHGRVVRIS